MQHHAIGQVLRRLREERRLSLRDMERASGVLLGVIGKIERGETHMPSVLSVARICIALGVSVDAVLVEAGILPRPPERPELAPVTRAAPNTVA